MKKTLLLFGLALLTLTSCHKDDSNDIDSFNENLIAYYPFNGNSMNDVGSNHNGLVDGATLTSDINASDNSAYFFNGIDNAIRVNHDNVFNLSNEFTISVLVKADEIKTQTIIRKGETVNGPGTWPYGIELSITGDIVFTVTTENGNSINQVRKSGYLTNEWYLITGVFKDSTMFLYVNGQLEATTTVSGLVNTNTDPLLIGTRLSIPSSTFKGIIDEVRIYDAALNASDIQDLYNSL